YGGPVAVARAQDEGRVNGDREFDDMWENLRLSPQYNKKQLGDYEDDINRLRRIVAIRDAKGVIIRYTKELVMPTEAVKGQTRIIEEDILRVIGKSVIGAVDKQGELKGLPDEEFAKVFPDWDKQDKDKFLGDLRNQMIHCLVQLPEDRFGEL